MLIKIHTNIPGDKDFVEEDVVRLDKFVIGIAKRFHHKHMIVQTMNSRHFFTGMGIATKLAQICAPDTPVLVVNKKFLHFELKIDNSIGMIEI